MNTTTPKHWRDAAESTSASRFAFETWVPATALCAALALLSGCGKGGAEATPTPTVHVEAAHPQRGAISDHILADAVLSPLAQAAVSPRISAPVRRFYVQRGSRVHAGELLVSLENRDLQAAAVDTRGTYTAAQASYQSTRGAQVPEETERARLDVAQAKATRDLDASIVAAREKLFQQGAIPGRDLDTSRATLVQAQAAYDVAAQHQQSLEAVSRQATLEQAKGAAQSAEGKYLGAEAQVSFSEIRSPIAGVVTDRPLFAGETAAAGAPLVTVMDTTALLAKVHLAQAAAQQVKVGDSATVTLPGFNDPVPARISLVSPALDPGSTTLEVWVRLDNRDGRFKVGTPVHTALTGRTVQDALTIPSEALQTAPDGSKYVMLLGTDGAAHRRPVKVGITDDGNAQIAAGLAGSDMVVTTGAYGLDDGTKVTTAAAESDAGKGAGKD